jgi:hypothetical protein
MLFKKFFIWWMFVVSSGFTTPMGGLAGMVVRTPKGENVTIRKEDQGIFVFSRASQLEVNGFNLIGGPGGVGTTGDGEFVLGLMKEAGMLKKAFESLSVENRNNYSLLLDQVRDTSAEDYGSGRDDVCTRHLQDLVG